MQRTKFLIAIALLFFTASLFGQESVTDATSLSGTWTGYYYCSQGKTGAILTIAVSKRGKIRGTYEFFPLPENPIAKTGSYSLKGRYFKSGKITLKPVEWDIKPFGYIMIGKTGQLSADRKSISGTVNHESCGEFYVERK